MQGSGQTPLQDIFREVREHDRVHVSAALLRPEQLPGLFQTRAVVIDQSPEPEGVQEFVYDYGRAVFVSGSASGQRTADWISGGGSLFDFPCAPVGLHEQASWGRHPSRYAWAMPGPPWPYKIYEASALNRLPDPDLGMLVSEQAPYFPDYRAAVLELVYGWQDPASNASPPSYALIVRQSDRRARIAHIHLSAASLRVTVDGDEVAGAYLELRGAGGARHKQSLVGPGDCDIALPAGLPFPLDLVLLRGEQWLDHRRLGDRPSPFDRTSAGSISERRARCCTGV